MKNYFSYENLWVFIATASLSLVFWCYSPYEFIPIWVAAILFFLCISFLWLVMIFWTKTPESIEKTLLKLVPTRITTINGETILLLQPNRLLFMGALVTIHQKTDDIEVYIATGQVSNIQTDGKIQVLLLTTCNISNNDLPSLIPKLGFSINALKDSPERFPQ